MIVHPLLLGNTRHVMSSPKRKTQLRQKSFSSFPWRKQVHPCAEMEVLLLFCRKEGGAKKGGNKAREKGQPPSSSSSFFCPFLFLFHPPTHVSLNFPAHCGAGITKKHCLTSHVLEPKLSAMWDEFHTRAIEMMKASAPRNVVSVEELVLLLYARILSSLGSGFIMRVTW